MSGVIATERDILLFLALFTNAVCLPVCLHGGRGQSSEIVAVLCRRFVACDFSLRLQFTFSRGHLYIQ